MLLEWIDLHVCPVCRFNIYDRLFDFVWEFSAMKFSYYLNESKEFLNKINNTSWLLFLLLFFGLIFYLLRTDWQPHDRRGVLNLVLLATYVCWEHAYS